MRTSLADVPCLECGTVFTPDNRLSAARALCGECFPVDFEPDDTWYEA